MVFSFETLCAHSCACAYVHTGNRASGAKIGEEG